MLSDEEKKAIEIVKEIKDIRGMRQDVDGEKEDLCALDTVINLIEKQSKEIEELKNTETYKIAIIDKYKYISKDKIKEIIKPTPENEIPIEVQQSEMYKKLLKEVEE